MRLARLRVAVVLASIASSALAQDDRAAALFREGRELATKGDYAAACPKFVESLALARKAGTALNVADCEEHLGHWAVALLDYQSVLPMLHDGDERIALVRGRIDVLSKRVARLAIVAPPDATVRRDGEAIPATRLGTAAPVDPGKHIVVISIAGMPERSVEVVLAEGESRELDLRTPGRAPPSERTAAPSTASSTSPSVGDERRGSRATGWIVGGTGVAGVAVTAVASAFVLSAKSTMHGHCDAAFTCDPTGLDAANTGKTWSTIGTVGFVVGVAGLGIGTYLLLESSDGATSVGVAPTSISFARRF